MVEIPVLKSPGEKPRTNASFYGRFIAHSPSKLLSALLFCRNGPGPPACRTTPVTPCPRRLSHYTSHPLPSPPIALHQLPLPSRSLTVWTHRSKLSTEGVNHCTSHCNLDEIPCFDDHGQTRRCDWLVNSRLCMCPA